MGGRKLFSFFKEILNLKERFSPENLSEIGWVATGQLLNIVLNFVIIKQISSIGTAGYGIYALILTINLLSGSLIYGPGIQAFLRFYYTYLEKGSSFVFALVMYRFIIFTGTVILILGGVSAVLNSLGYFSLSLPLIILCTIFIVTNRSNEFFSVSLNMIRKRKENSLLQNSEKILNILVLWAFYSLDILSVETVLITLILTSITFSLAKLFVFNKFGINHNENIPLDTSLARKEIKKTIFTYAVPFIIWGLAGWFQSNSEKWIIADYLTTSDVGIYALMMNLVNALVVVPNSIITDFSTPIIFQNFSDLKNKEKIKTGYLFIRIIVLFIFSSSIIISAVTLFFGKQIIKLISSEAFTAYWYLLPLLCIGTGLFYMGQAMCNIGMALNIPKKYIMPKIITGLLAVSLNILLINEFGITGIAYSSICLGIFYSAYIWMVNKRLTGEFTKI